jgi:hypothetical protein
MFVLFNDAVSNSHCAAYTVPKQMDFKEADKSKNRFNLYRLVSDAYGFRSKIHIFRVSSLIDAILYVAQHKMNLYEYMSQNQVPM